jgi:hypothetical protein
MPGLRSRPDHVLGSSLNIEQPCCRAIKTRATIRSIAFWLAKARPFDRVDLIGGGRPFDRRQRMLELWNNWYETLTSVEALATLIVIAVLGAGVITLVESRRR